MNVELVKEIARKAIIKQITEAATKGETCIWIKASQFRTIKDFLDENGFKYDNNPNYTMRFMDEEVLYKITWA